MSNATAADLPTFAMQPASTGHESVDMTLAAELRGELPEVDAETPCIGQACGRGFGRRFFTASIPTCNA